MRNGLETCFRWNVTSTIKITEEVLNAHGGTEIFWNHGSYDGFIVFGQFSKTLKFLSIAPQPPELQNHGNAALREDPALHPHSRQPRSAPFPGTILPTVAREPGIHS